jgi:lia operon protein LiaG
VLIAAAVAAGSLVLALAFGSVLHWDVPGPGWDGSRGAGTGAPFEESRSVPAQGIGRVNLEAASERIEIACGTADSFGIRLHGNVNPASAGDLPRLTVQSGDGTLSVKVERERTGWLWYDLVLTVDLPAGFAGSLSAASVSGSVVSADGTFQDLELSSTSGSVRAGTMKARNLTMGSTSGSIRLAAAEAESVRLSTTSGSIVAEGLAGAVRASSVNGGISLGFRDSPPSLDAQNTSGSVRISLPADARFSLEATSATGRVECAFPLTITGSPAGGHSLVGTVNGGTQPVKVRTVNGSIRIRR